MLRTALPVLALSMLIPAPETVSGQTLPPSGTAPTGDRPAAAGSVVPGLSPEAVPLALRPGAAAADVRAANVLPRAGTEAATAALQARDRGGIPFMVAGGALFVAGAVVGGDAGTLLMVGGAGVGAYGLYVYFGGT